MSADGRKLASRTYTVAQHKGTSRVPVVEVKYGDAKLALDSFAATLGGAGHDPAEISRRLRTWTAVLMMGGTGMTVLDPDLGGSVEINVKP